MSAGRRTAPRAVATPPGVRPEPDDRARPGRGRLDRDAVTEGALAETGPAPRLSAPPADETTRTREGVESSADSRQRQAVRWQRTENALIAVGILITMIAAGRPWWLLLAAFVVFDVSALGYLAGQRIGSAAYNVVHNYTAPAALVTGWAVLHLGSIDADGLVLLAACWGFHVAIDRALGFGLKLGPFAHTHLSDVSREGTAARTGGIVT